MASLLQGFLSFIGITPAAPSPAIDLTQEEFLARQKDKKDDFFLLDCRTEQEFKSGHIKNAYNISHNEASSRLTEIPRDQDVIIYCRTGRRVSVLVNYLASKNYTQLYHLDGDMTGWIRKQLPISTK